MSNIPSITIQAIPTSTDSCKGCVFQTSPPSACSSNAQKMKELGLPNCITSDKLFIYQVKKD